MYLKTLFGIVLLMGVQLTSCSQGASLAYGPLQPEPQHAFIARAISGAVAVYHYEKPEINDELSAAIYDIYLNDLDNNHSFFLSSDIEKFNEYRLELDDAMKTGDLAAPYSMFNLFTERFNETMDFVITHLSDSINYNSDITFRYDRDKQPFFDTKAELQDYWKKRIQYDLINLRLSNDSLQQNIETLTKRYTNMRKQSEKMKSEDVFQLFLNAFSEAIDPHTQYFSPKNAEDFRISMSKNLEGIGATLTTDGDYTVVVNVVKGSPAEKSEQVHPGDRIVAAAQGEEGAFDDLVGWRIDDVVQKIRGPKGSIVRLKIIPASEELTATPKVVTIVRDEINLEARKVQSKIKPVQHDGKTYNIGIITIPDFYIDFEDLRAGKKDYNSASRDVKKAILAFKEKGGVNGIVIDLRNNGGGSLKESIELSGLFINQGPVVQVKDTRGRIDIERDTDTSKIYSGPMVVLTNRFSASASEIFAGAMQDYQRAVIVGEQTFGKGTVQTQISINDLFAGSDKKLGQYNITIAKFYRISGGSTQHKGVIPDIRFPSAFPAEEFGESAEPTALPWDQIEAADYSTVRDLTSVLPYLEAAHKKRIQQSEEYAYLLEDIDEFKAKLNSHTEVLDFKQLQTERKQEKSEKLSRLNDRLIANGLKKVSIDEMETAQIAHPELQSDLIMAEGLDVLSQMIDLRTGAKKIAKTKELVGEEK